jgi:SGNH domain (fused to AT3 domains)
VLAALPASEPAAAARPVIADRITPSPLRAPRDVPSLYRRGCQTPAASAEPVACVFGDENSRTQVAVVGDSKIGQWMPAIESLAEQNGWRVVLYTKSVCAFSSSVSSIDGVIFEECVDWNANVLAELTGPQRPDYVITSHRRVAALPAGAPADAPETSEAMQAGLRQTWSSLTRQGTGVIVLLDNPAPDRRIYECVAQNGTDLERCAYERSDGIARSAAPTQRAAAQGLDGVEIVDLTHLICPTESCPPVIGNVLVYRQGSHLTATFVETLAPALGTALADAGLRGPAPAD